MKKLLLILIFFNLTFSVFSQDTQIGNKLKYEVINKYIYITDVYDKKILRFHFERAMNNTFYILRNNSKVGTLNIHTNDFEPFITQCIISWSTSNGGDVEWRQFATLIAEKITRDAREMYPPAPTPIPPTLFSPTPPAPTPPAPPVSGGNIQYINYFQPGMYYVQIGAYSNAAAARSEIENVDSSLPRAIMQVTVNIHGMNTNVNRVLIGPLDNAQSISVLQRYRFFYGDAFIHYGR